MSDRIRLGRLFSGLLVAGIVVLLAANIASNWEELRKYAAEGNLRFSPTDLALSGACFVLGFAALVQGWRLVVRALGAEIGYPGAFRVVVQSSMGRYIPGKIWAAAGLVYLGRRRGVPVAAGAAGAVISTVLVVMAGLICSLPRFLPLVPAPWNVLLPAAAFFLAAALLHPRVLAAAVDRLSRAAGRGGCGVSYRYGALGSAVPFYLIFWIGLGAGFVFSLRGIGLSPAPAASASAYAFAYAGGVLAFPAPGGVGVREGLLALGLKGLVSPALAAAVGVYARLWSTVLEALLFGCSFLVGRRSGVGIDCAAENMPASHNHDG
ncbi:MAG TPA: lysylphosphatidylglycerol synthase domain-containing protein [bacterium]|nr:lysylphosphatidylglycerol synthase domain-containing protein [bacterium]HPQ67162.1 lysylphosphatidylglycerol synthase domain-containing protein [bacterium]